MRLSTSLVDSSAHIQQHYDGLRAKVGGQVVPPPPKGIRYIKGGEEREKLKKKKKKKRKKERVKVGAALLVFSFYFILFFFFFLLGTSAEMRSGTDGCESYKERPRSFSPVKK